MLKRMLKSNKKKEAHVKHFRLLWVQKLKKYSVFWNIPVEIQKYFDFIEKSAIK